MSKEKGLRRIGKRLFVGAWVVAVATGCDGEEAPPRQTIAWDSSGVMIVESALEGGETARWKASSVQILVGMSDGGPEHELHRVRGLTRLQDGAIALLNGLPPEVRVFDPDGRFLWKLGGSGSGPGEFLSPSVIHRLDDDTLAVYDPTLQRFTLLSPEGRVTRTISPASQVFDFSGFVSEDRVISVRGTLQLTVGRIPDGFQEESPRIIEVVDLVTGARDTVVTVRGSEAYFAVSDQDGSGRRVAEFRVPFTVPPVIVVSDGQTYVLDPYRGTVSSYAEQGRVERIVRTSESPTPVERAHRERLVDELVERHPDRADEIRAAHAGMSFPEVMPLYDRLLATTDGVLWLRRYDPLVGAASSWLIFDTDGRASGEVRLPGDVEILHIERGRLTGLKTDTLGVEYVVELEVDAFGADERSTSHN